ncbi:MAG TPA: HNH endonuclease [Tissierellaceae bacterium]|nr:HNH endonuclease [Tissierellaceae bacterium]
MVRRKTLDKKYIYIRDGQKCFYCGKALKPGQMTLDHYQPRSKGGTDDYFNLVSCCRLCNKYKKNKIPVDKEKIHLELFHRAWKDKRIIWAVKGTGRKESEEIIKRITSIQCVEEESIARGDRITLYIHNNVIIRMDGDRMGIL